MSIIIIGIDLAKSIFAVHGEPADGGSVPYSTALAISRITSGLKGPGSIKSLRKIRA